MKSLTSACRVNMKLSLLTQKKRKNCFARSFQHRSKLCQRTLSRMPHYSQGDKWNHSIEAYSYCFQFGGNDTIKLYVHRNPYKYRISQQPDKKIAKPELPDPIYIIWNLMKQPDFRSSTPPTHNSNKVRPNCTFRINNHHYHINN